MLFEDNMIVKKFFPTVFQKSINRGGFGFDAPPHINLIIKKMAKIYKKRRYYQSKGRWSANIKEIADTQTLAANEVSGNSIDLCLNPIQDSLTVSQQFTVKNIELSVFMEYTGGTGLYSLEDIQHYIMYVPQGMNLTTNYNVEHPEYIMAYYYQGNPVQDNNGAGIGYKLKIKSRLARRLQTGDRIIYFWKAMNTDTQNSLPIKIGGLVRWWTKAN